MKSTGLGHHGLAQAVVGRSLSLSVCTVRPYYVVRAQHYRASGARFATHGNRILMRECRSHRQVKLRCWPRMRSNALGNGLAGSVNVEREQVRGARHVDAGYAPITLSGADTSTRGVDLFGVARSLMKILKTLDAHITAHSKINLSKKSSRVVTLRLR